MHAVTRPKTHRLVAAAAITEPTKTLNVSVPESDPAKTWDTSIPEPDPNKKPS